MTNSLLALYEIGPLAASTINFVFILSTWSNIIAFTKLLEFARFQKVLCTFFASSSSVYGDCKKFPTKEEDKLNPKNVYGLTKKFNEELAYFYSKNFNLKMVGLRFFTVFGPWGRPDMLTLKLLDKIKKKETFQINNFGNHFHPDFIAILGDFESKPGGMIEYAIK